MSENYNTCSVAVHGLNTWRNPTTWSKIDHAWITKNKNNEIKVAHVPVAFFFSRYITQRRGDLLALVRVLEMYLCSRFETWRYLNREFATFIFFLILASSRYWPRTLLIALQSHERQRRIFSIVFEQPERNEYHEWTSSMECRESLINAF